MFEFLKRRKKASHKIDAGRWAAAVFAVERGDGEPLENLLNELPPGPEGKELTPKVLSSLKGEDVVLIVGHGTVGSEPITDFLLKDGRIFVTRDGYDNAREKTKVQDVAAGAKLGIDSDIVAVLLMLLLRGRPGIPSPTIFGNLLQCPNLPTDNVLNSNLNRRRTFG